MADRPDPRVALMAIHPIFADAIMDGTKKVEFRKRSLAEDVTKVVVYATSPVQRVVGEFGIERTVVDAPGQLWETFGRVGSIERADFDEYFSDRDAGVALVIGWVRKYASPKPLAELDPRPAIPQSFSYVAELSIA